MLREALDATRGIGPRGPAPRPGEVGARLADAGRVDARWRSRRDRARAPSRLTPDWRRWVGSKRHWRWHGGSRREGARTHVMAELAPGLKDAGRVEEALTTGPGIYSRGLAGALGLAHALAAPGRSRRRWSLRGRSGPSVPAPRPREAGAPPRRPGRVGWMRRLAEASRGIGHESARDRALADLAPPWWNWAGPMRRWRRRGRSAARRPAPRPRGTRPHGGGNSHGAGDRRRRLEPRPGAAGAASRMRGWWRSIALAREIERRVGSSLRPCGAGGSARGSRTDRGGAGDVREGSATSEPATRALAELAPRLAELVR